MITIQQQDNLVNVAVMGEFTLADFHELENTLFHKLEPKGTVNLLVDLRDMLDFTLDVALEELKFTRQHSHDFGHIAVVTGSQWIAWSAWLSRLFLNANIEAFDDYDQALNWVTAG
jgi:hypothetical protein